MGFSDDSVVDDDLGQSVISYLRRARVIFLPLADHTDTDAEKGEEGFCLSPSTLYSVSGCSFYSDVNSMYLSSTEPPAAAEWACLLRPLRGREPEGVWNLLSIVREMFKRRDSNAAPLLEILTDQCLTYEQVTPQDGGALWWFLLSLSHLILFLF